MELDRLCGNKSTMTREHLLLKVKATLVWNWTVKHWQPILAEIYVALRLPQQNESASTLRCGL